MSSPETFDEYYARMFAYRQAELDRTADPVKRDELAAMHVRTREEMRTVWESHQRRAPYALSDETIEKIRAEHPRMERQRTDFEEHNTQRVINGEAA